MYFENPKNVVVHVLLFTSHMWPCVFSHIKLIYIAQINHHVFDQSTMGKWNSGNNKPLSVFERVELYWLYLRHVTMAVTKSSSTVFVNNDIRVKEHPQVQVWLNMAKAYCLEMTSILLSIIDCDWLIVPPLCWIAHQHFTALVLLCLCTATLYFPPTCFMCLSCPVLWNTLY